MSGNDIVGVTFRPSAAANPSAVDGLVESIRGLMREEGLRVGDSLPTERELCNRFGASRNTVREAMRMLKAYGVVSVRPRVGATIVDDRVARALDLLSFNMLDVSRRTFADVQGLRVLLEVASADAIFDLVTSADIVALRRENDALLAASTLAEASEADFGFHTRLVRVQRNKAILDVYRIMKPLILRIMQKGKTLHRLQTTTHSEHETVIAALEAGDRLAYQYLLKRHLNSGFAHFENVAGAGNRRGRARDGNLPPQSIRSGRERRRP